MRKTFTAAISAAMFLIAGTAMATPDPILKCKASKNKTAGAYYACRQKAEAKAIAKGLPADYGKCNAKFMEKWGEAETAGNTMCPDNFPTAADAETYVADQATDAAGLIGGDAIPVAPTCGDGVINAGGEHCDGAALDGLSCASFGLYGTLACTAGCDLNLAGCSACPAPGVQYGSSCWVHGAAGASCDTACATLGMVYDDATKIVAGSDGSNVNCVNVLDALGDPGDVLNYSGNCPSSPVGCVSIPGSFARSRCTSPATTGAGIDPADSSIQRACACK